MLWKSFPPHLWPRLREERERERHFIDPLQLVKVLLLLLQLSIYYYIFNIDPLNLDLLPSPWTCARKQALHGKIGPHPPLQPCSFLLGNILQSNFFRFNDIGKELQLFIQVYFSALSLYYNIDSIEITSKTKQRNSAGSGKLVRDRKDKTDKCEKCDFKTIHNCDM